MEFLQHFLVWQPTEKNGQESLGLRIALSDSANWLEDGAGPRCQ
jgi:hypothetical protein